MPQKVFLVDAKEAARLCGLSIRQWRRLVSAGKTPAPICLGYKTRRWPRREILAWVCNGCPDRVVWNARRGE